MNTINKGNYIVVKRGDTTKFCKIREDNQIAQIGKDKVQIGKVLGYPYGSFFRLVKELNENFYGLEKTDFIADSGCLLACQKQCRTDNRNIIDSHGLSQKLGKDEILGLKEKGFTGSMIIEHLIENSVSYEDKTDFAQKKYFQKKHNKYNDYIHILRPSVSLLSTFLYKQDPQKILNLRMDTLAQILCFANIVPGGHYLVLESNCMGLVVAAVLDRMSYGSITHLFIEKFPNRCALEMMNFPSEKLKNLCAKNLYEFLWTSDKNTINNEMNKNISIQVDTQNSNCTTLSMTEICCGGLIRKYDGLIIICKQYLVNILPQLLSCLRFSCTFVVYSPYKEMLVTYYNLLKEKKLAMFVKLSESWMREYQILDERTHPFINMSGGGGYLMTGIRVEVD